MACVLILDLAGNFSGAPVRQQYLFADLETARTVQKTLVVAAKAYHDRSNDREKMFTFEHLTGPASIDIASLLSAGVDDPFGPQRAVVEEWNTEMGKLYALSGKPPVFADAA